MRPTAATEGASGKHGVPADTGFHVNSQAISVRRAGNQHMKPLPLYSLGPSSGQWLNSQSPACSQGPSIRIVALGDLTSARGQWLGVGVGGCLGRDVWIQMVPDGKTSHMWEEA